ncbi:MAG: hypothetical protein LBS90_09035, partial [Oscillospiraceae bacterium]|nr:hypothetical protein [Oscillospiraceae bacterium]
SNGKFCFNLPVVTSLLTVKKEVTVTGGTLTEADKTQSFGFDVYTVGFKAGYIGDTAVNPYAGYTPEQLKAAAADQTSWIAGTILTKHKLEITDGSTSFVEDLSHGMAGNTSITSATGNPQFVRVIETYKSDAVYGYTTSYELTKTVVGANPPTTPIVSDTGTDSGWRTITPASKTTFQITFKNTRTATPPNISFTVTKTADDVVYANAHGSAKFLFLVEQLDNYDGDNPPVIASWVAEKVVTSSITGEQIFDFTGLKAGTRYRISEIDTARYTESLTVTGQEDYIPTQYKTNNSVILDLRSVTTDQSFTVAFTNTKLHEYYLSDSALVINKFSLPTATPN